MCYPTQRSKLNPVNQLSMTLLYNRTLDSVRRVQQSEQVNKVVEIWECQWKKMKSEHPEVSEFVKANCLARQPLNPRDAFFGE